jgi:hypothetical protein
MQTVMLDSVMVDTSAEGWTSLDITGTVRYADSDAGQTPALRAGHHWTSWGPSGIQTGYELVTVQRRGSR